MNTSILNKILQELKQEKPDISYVRGMLETLIEMQPEKPLIFMNQDDTIWIPTPDQQTAIKAAEIDARKKEKSQDDPLMPAPISSEQMEKIKKLAEKSVQYD